jgi:very-short-patch-repair endonuclease
MDEAVGSLAAAQTERALDNCLSARLISLTDLGALTEELARPGRPGMAVMRALLAARGEGYVAPASELEARFLRLVRAAGLPEPVRQHDVGDGQGWAGRADYAYPEIRLLIELDSRRHHMSKLDFEADRARDNRRVAAGWRPVRFTWDQVTRHPAEVVDVLIRSGVVPHRPGDANRRRLAS